MSDFNLKDIPQLTETNTLDGTAKLAIAVPTGVGSDHNLRYIQKGILARFDGTAVPTRMEFIGASRVMNFNGFSDSWLEYFTPSQALYLRGQILGISPDGSTIPARLESNGSVVGSNIKVTNGGNTYDVTFGGGSDETAAFTEGGNIQVNPKTTAITPTTGSTVNVVAAQWRVVYFELVGTIAALTINMPATPTEGQRVTLYFKEAVTSITHGAGGENLEGALTSAAAGQGATWVYQASASTWVPIGPALETPSAYRSVGTNYLATTNDRIIEATDAGLTVTLPTAAAAIAGYEYAIDNSSEGDITIATEGAQTIQGLATQTVPTQSCINVYSNGTNWRIK